MIVAVVLTSLLIMKMFFLTVSLLLFTHRWFTLIYSDGKNALVFGWTMATKAYLYYNIFTVYLNYILSKVVLPSILINIVERF